jgi:hypothetical protein
MSMKKLILVLTLTLAATSLMAGEGKSCDMQKGTKAKTLSLSGTVSCKGDDCTFKTADAKSTYTLCEMSKADLPKLSTAGTVVNIKGKVVTCEGKQKLVISQVADK